MHELEYREHLVANVLRDEPVSPSPGSIADAVTEALRRPMEERSFFVDQDNWALPAVENGLLDAQVNSPRIIAGP